MEMVHSPNEKEYGLYWYNKILIKDRVYNPKKALRYCSILERTLTIKIKYIIKKIKMQLV